MSSNIKSISIGLMLGLSPVLLCVLLFQISPALADKDQTELLSFGIMGVYAMSALAVFVIAMILILIKNKPVTGAVALFTMIAQLIFGVSYMAGI
jgi:surface polysaccharide O-acyltransferase-like enzyme